MTDTPEYMAPKVPTCNKPNGEVRAHQSSVGEPWFCSQAKRPGG